jgi:hypothetical protein
MTTMRQTVGITDHDLFVVQPHDHHPEVEHARVQINGTSIAPGDYEHRVQWTRNNHLVTEVVLAGPTSLATSGRIGAWAAGNQTSGEGNARFISGSGVYTYLASFSRLHGDTYLTVPDTFGSGIALKDVYLDGDETVLVFTNTHGTNQSLSAWGMVVAK